MNFFFFGGGLPVEFEDINLPRLLAASWYFTHNFEHHRERGGGGGGGYERNNISQSLFHDENTLGLPIQIAQGTDDCKKPTSPGEVGEEEQGKAKRLISLDAVRG